MISKHLFVAALIVVNVVGQPAVIDQLSNAVNDVSAKTRELVDRTANDIRNKTEKVSHDVQKQVDETSTTIGGYIAGIVRDVIDFIKSLFGDSNTPGQPALAEPEAETAEMAPQTLSSPRYTEKAVYLSLLGVLVYYVLLSCHKQERTKIIATNDCYRNLDECENFL